MKWNINDAERRLELIDEHGDIKVIAKFINKEELQDRAYTLYAYAYVKSNQLFIKFGEAKKQSIYDRYHRGTATNANNQMIAIWASEKGDKEIHKVLKTAGHALSGFISASYDELNTEEAYHILSEQGYTNILNLITKEAKANALTARYYREDYEDIKSLVDFILAQDKKFFCADLCTRWGKTSTFNLLFKKYNELGIRIHVVSSYVKTVKRSYSGEIIELTNNENALFIDADSITEDTLNQINVWLQDSKHYVVYYLPLTGDEDKCFKNRTELLKQLKTYHKTVTIEEADFGAACEKQVKKLKSFYEDTDNNVDKIFITTGTKIEKTKTLFKPECYVKRDYIIDVLAKRANAVGINWTVLNNSEMVKAFGYSKDEMENWTDIFTVEDGKLKGELYLRDLIDFLFNKSFKIATKENRKYRNHNLLNEAVTMWWTPVGKEAQALLKKLIEEVAPSYRVEIINGDETTNAEAEDRVKNIIKTTGIRLILISSGMASRSFSIKEIKNNILTCNAGDGASLTQKCFRGCTPWNEHKEMKNNIIDFRLAFAEPALASYLSNIAVDTLEENAAHKSTKELLNIINGTDKLTFAEYFSNGVNPLRELTDDEISIMLNSKDYRTLNSIKIINIALDTIDLPKYKLTEAFKINELINSNIKGDAKRKTYTTSATIAGATNKTTKQLEEDQRIQYLAYLLNHKEVFKSYKYENNILENEFLHNMPKERQEALEECLGLDMHVMVQIAELLIKNGIKLFD